MSQIFWKSWQNAKEVCQDVTKGLWGAYKRNDDLPSALMYTFIAVDIVLDGMSVALLPFALPISLCFFFFSSREQTFADFVGWSMFGVLITGLFSGAPLTVFTPLFLLGFACTPFFIGTASGAIGLTAGCLTAVATLFQESFSAFCSLFRSSPKPVGGYNSSTASHQVYQVHQSRSTVPPAYDNSWQQQPPPPYSVNRPS